ncbi:MAG: hypothetical protein RI932_478 [Pseudomonadota bacterium]|jgi:diaminopimelate epimerase
MNPLESLFSQPLKCEKWHGAENDFLFVNLADLLIARRTSAPHEIWEHCVAAMCQRNTGLGADGVVVWCHEPNQGKIAAAIWNSDGSRAQTCGNALRCLAGVLLEKKLWNGKTRLEVSSLEHINGEMIPSPQTFACLLEATQTPLSEEVSASVGMGTAVAHRTGLLQTYLQSLGAAAAPDWMQGVVTLTFVQLANPHLVVQLKPGWFSKFNREQFSEMGKELQAEIFCRALGIPLSNIGFVEPDQQNTNSSVLDAIVYERGAGLTQCCGSGGCAMRVALKENLPNPLPELLKLKMPGGIIAISEAARELVLTGPAKRIARLEADF